MDEATIRKVIASVISGYDNNTDALSGASKQVELKESASHKCTCKITLELALQLIKKVEEKANSMGIKVVIAVTNAGGNPVAVHCMDDSYIASYDIALNKAYTVVALKMPTSALEKLAAPSGSLYGIQFTNGGKIVIFGGGEPLYNGQKIVGGLGVSGGTLEQDTLLGEYGKEIFKEIL